MGHYCRICGRSRPNEQFSGRGHRIHVCKECQRLPRQERDRIERTDELYRFLQQSVISGRNVARLKSLTGHKDPQVARLATLILDVARAYPRRRGRWPKLARNHPQLFTRAVECLGMEFFEDLLAEQGLSESPLWDLLEEQRIKPPWTARPCDCGSGCSFQDCCLERENDLAD